MSLFRINVLVLIAYTCLALGTANGDIFRISNNTNSDVSIAWAVERTSWDSSGDLSMGSTHSEVRGWKNIVRGGETQIEADASVIYLLVLDSSTGKFLTYSNDRFGNGKKHYKGFMVHRTKVFHGVEFSSGDNRTADEVKKIMASNPPCSSTKKGKIRAGSSQSYSNWDSKFWPGDPDLQFAWGFRKCQLAQGKSEGTFYIE